MNNAAKSMLVYAFYQFGLGATLLLAPNVPLPLFGIAPTYEVWIRVAGMAVLFFAIYFVQTARYNLTPIIETSVYLRFAVPFIFGAFVIAGLAPVNMLLLATGDVLFAIWTFLALRQEKARMQPLPA